MCFSVHRLLSRISLLPRLGRFWCSASRCLQMDAAELDQEYLTDLVDRAVAALSVFPSLDLTSIAEELKTLLKAIVRYS